MASVCDDSTCGCRGSSDTFSLASRACEPLGVCFEVDGAPECRCSPGYRGSRCETCAVGYWGHPQCRENKQCDCVRGECDVTTGKCGCPSRFAGKRCESCQEGFAGDNCAPVSSDAPTHVYAILLGILLAAGAAYACVKLRARSSARRYGHEYNSVSSADEDI